MNEVEKYSLYTIKSNNSKKKFSFFELAQKHIKKSKNNEELSLNVNKIVYDI